MGGPPWPPLSGGSAFSKEGRPRRTAHTRLANSLVHSSSFTIEVDDKQYLITAKHVTHFVDSRGFDPWPTTGSSTHAGLNAGARCASLDG